LIESLLWLYFEISYILSSTFIFVFLVYSVNYLERTSLVIWIKSYFTLQHPLIFLFYESSRNFQAVCLTFSRSLKSPFAIFFFLSSIPLILLLLHHILSFSFSLCRLDILSVFATSWESIDRLYLDRTNIPNKIHLSRSSEFSRNAIRSTQSGVSCLLSDEESPNEAEDVV